MQFAQIPYVRVLSIITTTLHLKRNVQKQYDEDQSNVSIQRSGLSSKQGRVNVYSCVFCEFVQSNLNDIEEDMQTGKIADGAFEAKYLYHLRTVHGLER
jgi:hypothetical protein